MNERNWNDVSMPTDAELSTIPIPSDDAVRTVARNVRSLTVDDERVSVNTHGLIRPAGAVLHSLLFDPDPFHPEIVNGKIVFTVTKPLDIEDHGDACIRATVKGDADTHKVESVNVTAELA
ncbi:hypothetical protein [Halorubrum salsamenti]|uniref:hypothetical protein n=1 Tax=Halorubrum salsamenti TaxID=2583990 RepID=UPI0011A8A68B|nr:hypothetical protein [Halorubrum salsamenti]